MQKNLFKMLLIVAMMVVPWVAQGQGFNYTCNFDSDSDTAGWVFVNGSQANQWFIGTATHNSGTKSLYISNNNGTSNAYTNSSITFVYAYQEFTLDAGGYAISYDWKANGEGNYDYIRVFLAPSSLSLTAGQDPSGGTSAYNWRNAAFPTGCIGLCGADKLNQQTSWQNFITDFTVPTAGTYRLVFAWANDGSGGTTPPGAIDNIVFLQPTCPRPDNMQFANITPTSFDFSWTESGTATSWIIDIDSAGTSVLTDVVYDTFYSAIGLTANNMYTVRVAALCDGTDTSMWLSTNFHTPCSFIDSLPYQNGFENDPYYSAVAYAQAFPTCWTRINDATGTYNYYPYITTTASYVHSGSKGMYWYFTTTSGYAENEYAVLPGIDTTVYNISDLTLAFYAKTTSASYHPTPIVGVMTNPNDASTFTPVYTFSNTAITTDWMMYEVPFANYTGYGNFIAIKCPRTSSTAYMGIDDIYLTDEWCNIPLNVTATSGTDQVTVSWNTNGGTSFTVILGTDTVINLMDSSYTFTGLTANTPYHYSVATECTSSTSAFIEGVIRTACTFLDSLPYSYGFEDLSTGSSSVRPEIPCWHHINNGTTYFGYPYVSSTSPHSGSRNLYWYGSTTAGTYSDYQAVVLPGVDTNTYAINTLQLKFWARPSSTSYSPVFQVGVMTDPGDITTFQLVSTVNVPSGSTSWDEYIVGFGDYTGHGQYVAVRLNRPSSSYYAYTDDFTLETAPICPSITEVSLDNVGTTGALISWEPQQGVPGVPVGYEIEATPTAPGSSPLSFTTTGQTRILLTGLTNGTEYSVTVRADCGGDGYGAWSAPLVFSTSPLPCVQSDPTTSTVLTFNTGTGSTTTYYLPVGNYYNYSYTQQLILASEMSGATTITGIEFQYGYSSASTVKTNCTIYMANVSVADLSSGFVPYNASFTPVYMGNLNCTSGWNTFNFTTPFLYDGTSNLLIMIHDNSGDYDGSSYIFNAHNTPSPMGRYVQNDSNPYSVSSPDAGTAVSYRPNMKLHATGCLQYGTCAAPLVVVDSTNENEIAVSWAAGSDETSWDVEYRQGTAGTWTLASTETGTSYTFTGLSANSTYQIRITANCTDTSMASIITVKTPCGGITLPFTQTFESAPTSTSSSASFVDCMYRLNNGSTYYGYPYVGGSTYNHTPGGAKGLYWYNTTTTGTYGDYQVVVMPRVDASVTPVNTLQLSFWSRPSSTSYSPVFIVGVMTDPEDISTFQSVDTVNVANTTDWQFFEIPLYPYLGTGEYIALRANRPSSSWYAYVDDMTIENAPACPRVGDVVARNITQTDATIAWSPTVAGEYEVQYGPAGFTIGSGTFVNGIYDDSVNIMGLNPGTLYDVYVRGICTDDSSNWSFMYRFHTECSYATLPIIENFDAVTGSTATSGMANVLPPCWDYYNDGTRTNYQGSPYVYNNATYSHSGSNCIRFYSYNSSGDSNQYLILPVFDSNDYTIPDLQLSFWLRGSSSSSNYFNNVVVGVMTDPTNEYSFIPYDTILSSTTTYTYHEVNLNRYTGPHGRVTLLFPKPLSSSQYEYGYLDDLMLGPIPTCLSVDDLTSTYATGDTIILQWAPGDFETEWEVSYDSVTVVVYDTTYIADGLSPNTEYTFTVRAICGAGDTSYPVSYTARTDCGAITTLPYFESFEGLPAGSSTSPVYEVPCYGRLDNAGQNHFGYISTRSSWSAGPHTGDNFLYYYIPLTTGTHADWIITILPPIDNTIYPINSLQLSFWVRMNSATTSSFIEVGVISNANDETTFVPVDTVPVAGDIHTLKTAYLSSYTGTGNRIAMRFHRASETNYFFIDDIGVQEIPDCPPVTNVALAGLDSNEFTVTWTENGSATSWNIEYGLHGFTVGSGTTVIATTNSYTITGLTPNTEYDVYVTPDCSGGVADTTMGTFRTANSYIGLPFSCNFENAAQNAIWTLENGTNTNKWYIGTATNNGGTNAMYISDNNGTSCNYSYTSSTMDWAYVDLLLDSAGDYGYSFDWKCYGETTLDYLRVALVPASVTLTAATAVPSGYSSSALPAGWIPLDGGSKLNLQSSWQNRTDVVTVPSAGVYHLVFGFRCDASVGTMPPPAVDNVLIMRSPCSRPTNITISNLTQTSADISWHEPGNSTEWQYQVGTGPIVTVYDTSCSLTGLTANTPYSFKVRSVCGGGDTSFWLAYDFRTPCGYITLPYTQDFESETTSSSSTGSAFVNCWTRLNNGTSYGGYPYVSSSSTYNHTLGGSKGLYWYNTTTTGTYGDYQIVVLPPVDPSVSVDSLQLSFWAKASSTSYTPVFHVGVMTDPNNATTFVSLDTITIAGNTNWALFEIPLSGYTGSGQYVAVRALRPSSSWYAYVDDFDLDYIPSCPASRNVHSTAATTTSITIDWTDYSTPYAWEVMYTGNGVTSTTVVSTHPATLTSLTPATAYQIRVRPICSATDTGRWSEPGTAFTSCDLIVPPYFQDFDAVTGTSYSTAGQLPPCWDGYSNGTSAAYMPHVTDGSTYSYSITGNPLTLTSGSATYGDTKFVRLPQFATPINTITMSYWFCTESSTNGTLTVGYMTGNNYTTDFVPVVSHPASSASYHSGNGPQPAGTGVYDTVSFENVPDSAQYIAFKWVYTTSFYSCCIDNIEVTSTGAFCRTPTITGISHTYENATATWTGDANAYEVNIKESVAPDFTNADVTVVGTSYTFYGLQPATSYTVRVRQDCTADSIGYSDWVLETFVTDSLPCLPPDSLTVTDMTNATATFDWVPFGYETMWEVNVWNTAGFDSTYTVSSHPVILGGYTSGVSYNASVRPLCGSAHNIQGDWGDTVTFTAATCPDVTGLTAGSVQPTSLTLSWNNNPAADTWVIEYGFTGFEQGTGTQAVATTPTYVVTGLLEETSYDFYVRAMCGTDWYSENWAYVSATTPYGGVICDAPTGVSAVVAANAATVSWTAGEGNISYELEYGTHGFAHGTGTTQTATSSPITISNLNYETQYDVYVRAFCEQNASSAWSTVTSFTTEAQGSEDCDPVTNLTATEITENSAVVSWTAGATGSEWEVVLTNASGATLSEARTHEQRYQLNGLTPGTSYIVKVRTVCGDDQYSSFVSTNFTTIAVGIDRVAEATCTIYPNPTSSATTISVSGVSGKVKIAVVDMNGRTVASELLECSSDCTKTMDVERLAQGAYFVRITGENVNMVKKLIVR